jgi:addiction module RelB/DinJ family antitoxin
MITVSVQGHEGQHAVANLIHKIMLIGEYSLIQSFSLCLLTQQTDCSTIALQGGDSMAMESTLQVRMDSALKAEVEALYKSLGTSFAEAVRIFAQQSIREGGMPFTPSLKSWDELTQDEIDARLRKSMADVSAGRVLSQDQLDAKMREKFARE